MAGGVSKVCERSCWGKWLSHHSGGYFWCTLRGIWVCVWLL